MARSFRAFALYPSKSIGCCMQACASMLFDGCTAQLIRRKKGFRPEKDESLYFRYTTCSDKYAYATYQHMCSDNGESRLKPTDGHAIFRNPRGIRSHVRFCNSGGIFSSAATHTGLPPPPARCAFYRPDTVSFNVFCLFIIV